VYSGEPDFGILVDKNIYFVIEDIFDTGGCGGGGGGV